MSVHVSSIYHFDGEGNGHRGEHHQGVSQQLRGPGQRPVRHHQQLSQQEDVQGQGGVLHHWQEIVAANLQIPKETPA